MILGFTGTRHQPTEAQQQFIWRNMFDATELHHGCCEGSDKAAHDAATPYDSLTIWLHPPTDQKLMVPLSKLLTRGGIHALSPKQYHARNRDIADACDVLIATPDGPRRPHSGTWYTIDYALSKGIAVVTCLPDGSIDPSGST